MRLIELRSSRTSFKTVTFNPSGLSLIVGRRKEESIQATYNGVGKSLLTALIHYCLGSSKNKEFEEHLNGWDFSLTFDHNERQHVATRAAGRDKIEFDGQQVSVKQYKDQLDELGVFDSPTPAGALSFRNLISYFIRPARSSYNFPDQPIAQWTPYTRVLTQSFLLGLDYNLAIQKHEDKTRVDKQIELANRFKSDKELRDYYTGGKNAEMELSALKERIRELERNLKQFAIARDYSERQADADVLHTQILKARNEEAILAGTLSDIDLAMALRPDVTPDRIRRLYEEAEVALPDLVTKRLEEVDKFYARIRENRLLRLTREKAIATRQLEDWQKRRAGWQNDLDLLLQYLKAHRALDEYTENNRFLSELTGRARKIEDYLSLVSRHMDEAQRIKAQMAAANVDTTRYLHGVKSEVDGLREAFRNFAREFYGDKPAGLVISNNVGDNQVRFDIEARIEHDAADGINQVRIFCFDLLLLTLRKRHAVEFLIHDSRLYAEMDPHQRLTLFRLARQISVASGFQYIATVNEDQLESLREAAGNEFEDLFVNSRVLELSDERDGSGKLLGVQVEMEYEVVS